MEMKKFNYMLEINILTLPMMRLLLSKAQESKDLWKPSKPCHVGIHWIAHAEYSQMRAMCHGFSHFTFFFASFCIDKISHPQHIKG